MTDQTQNRKHSVFKLKETGRKSIKQVLYNKQKTAGGFVWNYLD